MTVSRRGNQEERRDCIIGKRDRRRRKEGKRKRKEGKKDISSLLLLFPPHSFIPPPLPPLLPSLLPSRSLTLSSLALSLFFVCLSSSSPSSSTPSLLTSLARGGRGVNLPQKAFLLPPPSLPLSLHNDVHAIFHLSISSSPLPPSSSCL